MNRRYGIALDIGTTTLDMSLICLDDGKEAAADKRLNPQRKSGQDVLTRILYEQRFQKTAVRRMQELVVDAINQMIAECIRQSGICEDWIEEMVVAANCVMTHMLLGVDATGMGQAPYMPAFLHSREISAAGIGIRLPERVRLRSLPHAAAFFGGDALAGVDCCRKNGSALFLDIGTNGEIALVTDEGVLACSCAAGPALEGMNISCGMTAQNGAIESVYTGRAGEIACRVIGDVPAKGICGSGLLSLAVWLLKNEGMDKTGLLSGGRQEIVLSTQSNISVTQKDIRQLQLAKGAILAAVRTLLYQAETRMERIDHVYVAGQFGEHLSEELFTETGILPTQAKGKISYLGNTSKQGAVRILTDPRQMGKYEALADEIVYVELAQTDEYMRLFMDSMNF